MNIDLDGLFVDLINSKTTCEKASEIMKSSEVRSTINSYINKDKINPLIPYFNEDLQIINSIINVSQFIYNNSGLDTGITDSEYDKLYAIMIDNGGGEIISVQLPSDSSNVVYHKYPSLRGTLTKTYYLTLDEKRTNPSRKYLDEWKSSMENKIFDKSGKRLNLDNEEIYVFPKFDGVSGIFEEDKDGNIQRVLTRGDTERNEAQNIIHQFSHLPQRKYSEFNSDYGLKTEIMMQEKDLEYFNDRYNTNYKNTRSIVSAIINSDEYDPDKARLLEIVPLRVGDENGDQQLATEVFNFPYIRCRLRDREVIRKFALEHRYVNNGLRCDGAVIYIINPEVQKILGRENNKNNYEVAYKFTEEVQFSKLKDVSFEVGLFGRLSPVAKIKPVKMKGNTINNISLGSIGRLKRLNLHKGDKIKVLYDIIPYLSFDSECKHNMNGDPIEIPSVCPECGEKLVSSDSGDIISCVNQKCPCRIKGKILNYLNKMNIDQISYGVIDKLYDNGIVKNIKDLYKIDKHAKEIVNIDGFGPTIVSSWINQINNHRTEMDYVVLGALGIEGVSKKTFEKILADMSIDELIYLSGYNRIAELTRIPGIKDKTAKKIMEGVLKDKDLIDYLQKELTIISSHNYRKDYKYTVCFTKIRDKDAEEYVNTHEGKVVDSLTKDTTFLVVPSKEIKSSKVSKAEKYGIPVITIDDLKETIQKYIGVN